MRGDLEFIASEAGGRDGELEVGRPDDERRRQEERKEVRKKKEIKEGHVILGNNKVRERGSL